MRKILIISLSIAIVAYLAYAFITIDRRSDETQVLAIIQATIESAEKHSANGTMASVSKNYKDETGTNYDRLRILVVQILDNELKYKISTEFNKLNIAKGQASANIQVEVKTTGNESVLYNRDLVMVLKKERSYHALIIPVHAWRITSVKNLGFVDL